MSIPVDRDEAAALALAQSAMKVAEDARREAAETRDAMRSIYIALGDLTRELRRLAAADEVLAEQLARLHPRSLPPPPLAPMRERAPSVHEIAQEAAEAAATKFAERTAPHVIPSQPVVALIERERNRAIVAGVLKVAGYVLPPIAALLIGHFLK
ncbi:MAG TPA: hypothetical protein VMI75_31140 [Polyangiaceae bacterium]|nr:hypothetical protein [Polyangiaceae bacterium]